MSYQNNCRPIQTTFKLKVVEANIQKVYIEFESIGYQSFVQYEMKRKQTNLQEFIYQQTIQIQTQTNYKYRYIFTSNNNNKQCEENFRNFKQNKESENYVDEWNQVWCIYQFKWNTQEFFEGFMNKQESNILKFLKRVEDYLIFQCKKLLPNDDKFLSEQLQIFEFEDTQNNDKSIKENINVYKNQEIHLNCVFTEVTFVKLGKMLADSIGKKMNDQIQFLEKTLELKDKSQQILNEKIYNLQQELLSESNKFQIEFSQFQNFSSQKINENIEQIKKLQQELDGYKQKEIQFKIEQMKIQKLEISLQVNEQQQSKNQIELAELLQKYQDSVNQLEVLKNEDKQIMEKNKQQKQFLKHKNDKLMNQIKICEAKLQDVEQKLLQCEQENANSKVRQQQSQKTIQLLRIQIQTQKKELEQYKQALYDVKINLEERELQKINLQKEIEIQLQRLHEQEERKKEIIEAFQNQQKQFEEESKHRFEIQKQQILKDFEIQANQMQDEINQQKQQALNDIQLKYKETSLLRSKIALLEEKIQTIEKARHKENQQKQEQIQNLIQNLQQAKQEHKQELNEFLEKSKLKIGEQNEKEIAQKINSGFLKFEKVITQLKDNHFFQRCEIQNKNQEQQNN